MSKTTAALAALGVVAGLGVAALPLSSYAVEDQEDIKVTLSVNDSISITTTDPDNPETALNAAPITAATDGGVSASSPILVTVKTNNEGGYTVKLKDKDATTALTTTGDGTPIPSGTPTQGVSAWGFALLDSTATGADENTTWQSFAESQTEATLETKSSQTAEGGDKYKLFFGASLSADQTPGTYTNDVQIVVGTTPAA